MDDDGKDEIVEFGPRRPLLRSPWLLIVAVLAVVVVGLRLHQRDPTSAPQPSPAITLPAPAVQSAAVPPVVAGPPRTTQVGRLLGITGDWDLFALGADEVVRIQPGLGRVTRTPFPGLRSNAVAFVPVRGGVIVRPWDVVTGYLVSDGSPARPLAAALSEGGAVFPGPDDDHVWMQRSPAANRSLVLVRPDGTPAGATIRPTSTYWPATGDGSGYMILTGIDGAYLARPDGARKITSGSVLAAGPTGWLVVECDKWARCVRVVIDRATGGRRSLPSSPSFVDAQTGTVAPDGSMASYIPVTAARPVVHLLDLYTGADRALTVDLGTDGYGTRLVWSPDGRWLFLAAGGRLLAVDPRTGAAQELGGDLPAILQVAVRARR